MKPRLIAFYLPQYHPIHENDIWWSRGFTEWTNVGKAKALFPGHHQPKVPADLGYYDLRIPEVRDEQAKLAMEAGLAGFCYWHYWYEGKRLLELPFQEVINSGKPDFPFCLCWANHSWYAKNWNKDIPDKLLIEQKYGGKQDYENHFYAMLKAFKDPRYLKVNGRLLFGIYSHKNFPDVNNFIDTWNDLAAKNGLTGFYFFAISYKKNDFGKIKGMGFDAITYDTMFIRESLSRYLYLAMHKVFKIPQLLSSKSYIKTLQKHMPVERDILPCIIPNFDHTPRSGRRGSLMTGSTPDTWRLLLKKIFEKVKKKEGDDNIIFIKSWNEWGEGNYLEPDLKYGKSYLNAIKEELANL